MNHFHLQGLRDVKYIITSNFCEASLCPKSRLLRILVASKLSTNLVLGMYFIDSILWLWWDLMLTYGRNWWAMTGTLSSLTPATNSRLLWILVGFEESKKWEDCSLNMYFIDLILWLWWDFMHNYDGNWWAIWDLMLSYGQSWWAMAGTLSSLTPATKAVCFGYWLALKVRKGMYFIDLIIWLWWDLMHNYGQNWRAIWVWCLPMAKIGEQWPELCHHLLQWLKAVCLGYWLALRKVRNENTVLVLGMYFIDLTLWI